MLTTELFKNLDSYLTSNILLKLLNDTEYHLYPTHTQLSHTIQLTLQQQMHLNQKLLHTELEIKNLQHQYNNQPNSTNYQPLLTLTKQFHHDQQQYNELTTLYNKLKLQREKLIKSKQKEKTL